MPYRKDSPLKDKVIRKMVTAACYVEIALAVGGEWDPGRLEEVIDGKAYYSFTGRYRRLFRGIVPSDRSAKDLKLQFNGKCDLLKWRDHPFWKLLSTRPLTHSDIETALSTVTSNVKHYVWMQRPPREFPNTNRGVRTTPERESIDRIAKYRNFDSLLTLVAYAREGRDSGMLQEYGMSSGISLKIFPQVVARNPHLYVSWKPLAKRLNSLIWNPKNKFFVDLRQNFNLSLLNKEIETLVETTRNKGSCFPPKDLMKRFA